MRSSQPCEICLPTIMLDVVTLGTATVDIFFDLSESDAVRDVGKLHLLCTSRGAKMDVAHSLITSGGGAINVARGVAARGLSVAAVFRVGVDGFGDQIVRETSGAAVATFAQRDPIRATGVSVVLSAGKDDRSILVARGAAGFLDVHALSLFELTARWWYCSSFGVSDPAPFFAAAKKVGASIAWNPGRSEIARGLGALAPLLAQTAIFFLNREEAAILTGTEKESEQIAVLRAAHVPVGVITGGEHGALAFDATTIARVAVHEKVVVRDRTGAGDAFASGFLAGWQTQPTLVSGLAHGLANAEGVVAHLGAHAGLWGGRLDPARVVVS